MPELPRLSARDGRDRRRIERAVRRRRHGDARHGPSEATRAEPASARAASARAPAHGAATASPCSGRVDEPAAGYGAQAAEPGRLACTAAALSDPAVAQASEAEVLADLIAEDASEVRVDVAPRREGARPRL